VGTRWIYDSGLIERNGGVGLFRFESQLTETGKVGAEIAWGCLQRFHKGPDRHLLQRHPIVHRFCTSRYLGSGKTVRAYITCGTLRDIVTPKQRASTWISSRSGSNSATNHGHKILVEPEVHKFHFLYPSLTHNAILVMATNDPRCYECGFRTLFLHQQCLSCLTIVCSLQVFTSCLYLSLPLDYIMRYLDGLTF